MTTEAAVHDLPDGRFAYVWGNPFAVLARIGFIIMFQDLDEALDRANFPGHTPRDEGCDSSVESPTK